MSLEKTINKFRYLEEKGIIGNLRKLFNFTDEPHFFQYVCNYLEGIIDNRNEGISTDIDDNRAKVKALGECIERYSLQKVPDDLIVSSYNSLKDYALDPCEFVNFSNSFLNNQKDTYLNKLREIPLSWSIGRNALNQKEVLIPAQLVYVPLKRNDPIIRSQISTGTAAHEDLNTAITSGLLECVERDSFMLAYYSRDLLKKVELDGELKELEDYFNRYYLSVNVFDMTSDLEIPSFICLNLDYTGLGPAVSVGLSSDFSSRKAILKSMMESQQSRQWMRFNYAKEKKIINNPEEINSVTDRGYYWYPVESINHLDFLLNNPKSSRIRNDYEAQNMTNLLQNLHEKGIEGYTVDITPKVIEEGGFKVIKAICPKLHPLFLYEDFPHLYSERLMSKLNGREINSIPHPFM